MIVVFLFFQFDHHGIYTAGNSTATFVRIERNVDSIVLFACLYGLEQWTRARIAASGRPLLFGN